MEKINFENAEIINPAKVTIEGIDYEVTPAQLTVIEKYLSAETLNKMQSNIEESCVIVSPTEPNTNEKVWIQKGKNLFNKNTITSGKRLTNGNSGTYDSPGNATSEYIKILPNTDYCISNYTAYHIYDKSGIVIQQDFVDSATTKNVNTLENAYTMRISSLRTDLDSVQLEQGSTATEYEEYIEEVLWLKNNNGMFEPFYKKNEATSKFVYLGGKTFESTAVAGTAETFELLESAKNYDLLFIQASPDHEGGTGLLFPKASNGSNVIIHVGPGVGGNYDGIIRVWQEINDRTTIRMRLLQKGSDRPANNFGVKAIYGIKF